MMPEWWAPSSSSAADRPDRRTPRATCDARSTRPGHRVSRHQSAPRAERLLGLFAARSWSIAATGHLKSISVRRGRSERHGERKQMDINECNAGDMTISAWLIVSIVINHVYSRRPEMFCNGAVWPPWAVCVLSGIINGPVQLPWCSALFTLRQVR